MTIPYIEYEGSKDENLHGFEIVNIKWVQKKTVLRKLVMLKATRITTKYFLKHRLPFQCDLISRNPKRISPIRLKTVNQRFELYFKPGKRDYKRAADIKQNKGWLS
jgi:hypothetical protein